MDHHDCCCLTAFLQCISWYLCVWAVWSQKRGPLWSVIVPYGLSWLTFSACDVTNPIEVGEGRWRGEKREKENL